MFLHSQYHILVCFMLFSLLCFNFGYCLRFLVFGVFLFIYEGSFYVCFNSICALTCVSVLFIMLFLGLCLWV